MDGDRYEGDNDSENDDVVITGATNLIRDQGWSIVTRLVYPEDSSTLSLKHQNQTIQLIVQRGIKNVRYNINAFPDSRMKVKFSRDALHKAASDLGFRDVSRRLSRDLDYVTTLAELVSPSQIYCTQLMLT